MTKHIRVIAGDRGGWNAIEPVVQRVVDDGHTVAAYFVGTCAEQYIKDNLKVPPQVTVLPSFDQPNQVREFVDVAHDLTLIGASQSDVGTVTAMGAIIFTEKPVVFVEDYYGSARATLKRSSRRDLRKVTLCLIDDLAQVKLAGSDFDLSFVKDCIITGGPHFDKIATIKRDWADRRQKLREAMGVRDSDIVALIAGQLSGTAESLLLFIEAMQKLQMLNKAYVVLRTHPRAKWPDLSLLEYCRRALPDRHYIEVSNDLAQTSEDYLPGVDFVLSGYATVNYAAILCEMPGVVYVGTPSHRYEYFREKEARGNIEQVRPIEVELNAAWYAQHPDELADIIQRVQAGDVADIKQAQRSIAATNDGHATDRVYDVVMKCAEAR